MDLNKTEGTTLESTMDQIQKLLNMKQNVLATEIKKQTNEALQKRDQMMSENVNKQREKIKKTYANKGKKNEHLSDKAKKKKNYNDNVKNVCKRTIGNKIWVDTTMNDWCDEDYRIFAGDLGNEVSDEHLAGVFRKYNSFLRAKVIRDKRTGKTKGYGFISFANPDDYIRAMKENNGKYLGKRPLNLTRSKWKDRTK